MTAATVEAYEFRDQLPPRARAALHHTARLEHLIAAAIDQGWTIPQLVKECGRDLAAATNPAAVVMHRLGQAARHPPVAHQEPRKVPFCSPECRDNAGWLLDPDGRPKARCQCRKAT